MVTKHTPGPFVAELPGRDDRQLCRIHAPVAGGWIQVGATWHPEAVVSGVGLSREECMANARLFALAPRLLAACRRALDVFGAEEVDADNMTEEQAERLAAILELEDAVAEADGEDANDG
jgi:hypothetical protein